MRRVCAVLFCCAVVQLTVPTRAYAWWDFLEEFSGPGPFWGPDFDARVACLVDTSNTGARDAAKKASDAARSKSMDGVLTPGGEGSNVGRWKEAMEAWEKARQKWETLAGGARYVGSKDKGDGEQAERKGRRLAAAKEQNAAALADAWREAAMAFEQSTRALQAAAADTGSKVRIAGGVIYSACGLKAGERRRASIDIGARLLWTRHKDDRFAGGEQIQLTTLEPAISWSVFNSSKTPWLDVVDYGIGAGAYWITSKGFPSLRGGFVEPARFDFHAPTKAYWLARVPVLRVSWLVFPSGFEPTAFVANPPVPGITPPVGQRIPRDKVFSWGIYIDLQPFHDRSSK